MDALEIVAEDRSAVVALKIVRSLLKLIKGSKGMCSYMIPTFPHSPDIVLCPGFLHVLARIILERCAEKNRK